MQTEYNTEAEGRTYTEEDLRAQIKPLPENKIARFSVQLYRRWLEAWYNFFDRHGKAAGILQKVFFFLVFSLGVTVWQYVVMTFLPYAFDRLNDGAWGWPDIGVPLAGGQPYIIFGDAQGLGYFIAFEIAVFTAQCINFPLQRNVTYRSHGNPVVQAIWYFIGWVLISVFTGALWGICNCFLINWGVPDAVSGIVKTMLTGLLSMVIFFFIFLIIFPDNVKLAKKARGRYDRARSRGVAWDRLVKIEEKAVSAERRARISEAEKALFKATSQASSAAMRYFAMKPKDGEEEEEFSERKRKALEAAGEAIQRRADALNAFDRAESFSE